MQALPPWPADAAAFGPTVPAPHEPPLRQPALPRADRRVRPAGSAGSVVAFCRATPVGITVISTAEIPAQPFPPAAQDRNREPKEPAAGHPLLDADFDTFYAEYDPLVRRIVASHRVPRSDAEDCLQEIWTEILGSLPRLEYDPARGPLEAWLFTLVRRKIWSFTRSGARNKALGLSSPERTVVSPEPGPAAATERRERRRLVREALERIRPRVSKTNYRILHLRWVEEHTPAEIGTIVGLPPRMVRYRLARMKPKLRAILSRRAAK